MQALEPVDDGVQATQGGLIAQLNLFLVLEVEDDLRLKHKESLCKAPLLGAPTVGVFDPSNKDQRTAHRN